MAKKILIIYAKSTDEIFNRQSALGSYIHCLATILLKNGYEVSINDISFSREFQSKSSSTFTASSSFIKKIIPGFIKEGLKDYQLFKRLKALFDSIKAAGSVDCILEFYTYGSEIGSELSKRYNKPLFLIYDNPVLEEHAFFHDKQVFFKKRIEDREERTVQQAVRIVAYSNAVREYLNKKYSKQLPVVIHQNVDYTRFDFIEEKRTAEIINIGFIGSFLKWHRVDLLISVFTRLRKAGKPCQLYLVGAGMEFETIKGLANKSEFASDIFLPGFSDGPSLVELKKKIEIGIMPGSNWYGAPNKIFEYGAARMAVVAPDTPTIRDLFNNKEELLLFQQDNETSLYNTLLFYLENNDIRQEHALKLQNKIRNNYSENITFTFYNQLFSLLPGAKEA
ncbi:MAG TPA: glycosyltransferase family 4 protein [Bacteroidia bacterium]